MTSVSQSSKVHNNFDEEYKNIIRPLVDLLKSYLPDHGGVSMRNNEFNLYFFYNCIQLFFYRIKTKYPNLNYYIIPDFRSQHFLFDVKLEDEKGRHDGYGYSQNSLLYIYKSEYRGAWFYQLMRNYDIQHIKENSGEEYTINDEGITTTTHINLLKLGKIQILKSDAPFAHENILTTIDRIDDHSYREDKYQNFKRTLFFYDGKNDFRVSYSDDGGDDDIIGLFLYVKKTDFDKIIECFNDIKEEIEKLLHVANPKVSPKFGPRFGRNFEFGPKFGKSGVRPTLGGKRKSSKKRRKSKRKKATHNRRTSKKT